MVVLNEPRNPGSTRVRVSVCDTHASLYDWNDPGCTNVNRNSNKPGDERAVEVLKRAAADLPNDVATDDVGFETELQNDTSGVPRWRTALRRPNARRHAYPEAIGLTEMWRRGDLTNTKTRKERGVL